MRIAVRRLGITLMAVLAITALHASEPVFRVGVCTHFSQYKGQIPANLEVAKQAGVYSIRDEAAWRVVEPEKGRLEVPNYIREYVEDAKAAGLEPMIIFDYGNKFYDGGDKPLSPEAVEAFAAYAEFLVREFRGQVKLWEVWNEYDIGIGGTTPGSGTDYAKLLRAVYPRIKKADPSITVLGGAMTSGGIQRGWLKEMLEAGALDYLDEVSVHTYRYSETGRKRGPEAWAEWMFEIEELLKEYSGGKEVPLNVTEMGWPVQVDRRGTPPEVSAAYLARMYLLARTMPFMKGVWWYDFQDDGWRHEYNENNFGLVRPDLTPKPSYFALADVAGLVADATYEGRVDAGDPDVYVLKFRQPSGERVWAVWSAHPDDGWQVTLRRRAEVGPLRLKKVGSGSIVRPWATRDWPEKREKAMPVEDEISLVVGQMPWLVSGELQGVSVVKMERREFPELLRGVQVER